MPKKALLRLLSTQAQLLEKQGPISARKASLTGQRGVAAREAFLRIFEQPSELADGVAKRAQQGLGLSSQEPATIKDLKTVQIFFSLACQIKWEDYRRQGKALGEAWAARGLVMAGQIAVDQGRTQLGFLLSGLPDIHHSSVLPSHRY